MCANRQDTGFGVLPVSLSNGVTGKVTPFVYSCFYFQLMSTKASLMAL